jgi:hypothetical protein
MNDAADLIVTHYERHALSWDADRRAAPGLDPSVTPFVGGGRLSGEHTASAICRFADHH